ncbi:WD repeat and SOF domain-containing protein 1 [Nosema bombycis CQ1]|uniref:WD repeat and SOF domain-containing protein 1 n=1 Tax=Nosema bombycis (strain CQ1 / CVCC 102059) TaxID=578461 RepID=R0MJ07_NOSB1|nr:WD repeat and SOF domain-containing protein 1 [Nosema bombycis CQ1]|eukprot:EOB14200.1 WD repeat and SOF domain-containing protein 1 [Nosema bombycis CQ1]
MQINTIYHSIEKSNKERKNDLHHTNFSRNDVHHPFIKEREVVRAMNYAKINRMMAKPFVGYLSFHKEGINMMAKHPTMPVFITASFDNEIVVSDLDTRTKLISKSFDAQIKGVGISTNNMSYFGIKKTVRSLEDNFAYDCKASVNNICVNDELYVSTSQNIQIFDFEKPNSKQKLNFKDTQTLSTNPSFTHLLGFADNTKTYVADLRSNKVICEFEIGTRTNSISFSPAEGFMMSTANEDMNGYVHDLRRPDRPVNTLRGSIGALTAIRYNPTGTEICTGSYDKTIRIFRNGERKSRDVYYNKRMHNIYGLEYTNDGEYIVSGSDDGTMRIWRSEASRKTGTLNKQEKNAFAYGQQLIDKYKDIDEVDRINKHRFLPKIVKIKKKEQHEHYEALKRKEARRKDFESKHD